jgi:hypothetical protein
VLLRVALLARGTKLGGTAAAAAALLRSKTLDADTCRESIWRIDDVAEELDATVGCEALRGMEDATSDDEDERDDVYDGEALALAVGEGEGEGEGDFEGGCGCC